MKSDKKVCLIACWFGKLPNYFDLWALSCSRNQNIDYLLFTDQKWNGNVKNIHVINIEFDNIKKMFESKIGMSILLPKPYKICDFRPMFGVIFSDYLTDYEFWGFCDLDVIWGDFDSFINDEMLDEFDALFNGGHFSLLRNCSVINNLYKKNGSVFEYKDVIRNDAVYAFDEYIGIQSIARENNIRAYYFIPYIDTDVRYNHIQARHHIINYDFQVFYWDRGKLFRSYLKSGQIFNEEFLYIHLQKRKMNMEDNVVFAESFWIDEHDFYVKKTKDSIDDFKCHNIPRTYLQNTWELILYYTQKVIAFLRMNNLQKKVRIIQQRAGINDFGIEEKK